MAFIVVWLVRILMKAGKEQRGVGLLQKKTRLVSVPGNPCPLCGTPLQPGERVHSVVYPGKTDKLVEIYGCPHCRPTAAAQTAARVCPVCKRELGDKSYLIARMFDRGDRKHVHVLGCTRCRGSW